MLLGFRDLSKAGKHTLRDIAAVSRPDMSVSYWLQALRVSKEQVDITQIETHLRSIQNSTGLTRRQLSELISILNLKAYQAHDPKLAQYLANLLAQLPVATTDLGVVPLLIDLTVLCLGQKKHCAAAQRRITEFHNFLIAENRDSFAGLCSRRPELVETISLTLFYLVGYEYLDVDASLHDNFYSQWLQQSAYYESPHKRLLVILNYSAHLMMNQKFDAAHSAVTEAYEIAETLESDTLTATVIRYNDLLLNGGILSTSGLARILAKKNVPFNDFERYTLKKMANIHKTFLFPSAANRQDYSNIAREMVRRNIRASQSIPYEFLRICHLILESPRVNRAELIQFTSEVLSENQSEEANTLRFLEGLGAALAADGRAALENFVDQHFAIQDIYELIRKSTVLLIKRRFLSVQSPVDPLESAGASFYHRVLLQNWQTHSLRLEYINSKLAQIFMVGNQLSPRLKIAALIDQFHHNQQLVHSQQDLALLLSLALSYFNSITRRRSLYS